MGVRVEALWKVGRGGNVDGEEGGVWRVMGEGVWRVRGRECEG